MVITLLHSPHKTYYYVLIDRLGIYYITQIGLTALRILFNKTKVPLAPILKFYFSILVELQYYFVSLRCTA